MTINVLLSHNLNQSHKHKSKSTPQNIHILYNSIYKKFENRILNGLFSGVGEEAERKQRLEGWSFPRIMELQFTYAYTGCYWARLREPSANLQSFLCTTSSSLILCSTNPSYLSLPEPPTETLRLCLGFSFLPWVLETAFRQDAAAIEGLTSFVCLFPWVIVWHSLLQNV